MRSRFARLLSLLLALSGCASTSEVQPKQGLPPAPRAEEAAGVHLAFILLDAPTLPSADRVQAAWRRISPEAGPLTVGAPKQEGALELRASGGGGVVLALIPAPIPGGEAEAASQRSIAYLAGAFEPSSHQAHLVAAGTAEDRSAQALARFTRLVAAVAEASEATAVYWGEGQVTHPLAFFVEVAREQAVPAVLWNGVSIARDGDRVSLLSLGMAQLGLRDLEITAPVSRSVEAMEWLFHLLGYVAGRGEDIPDGDTVGRSANERIRVQHRVHPVEAGSQVVHIAMP